MFKKQVLGATSERTLGYILETLEFILVKYILYHQISRFLIGCLTNP